MTNSNHPLPFISASAIGSDVQELVNLSLRQIGDLDTAYNFGFIYLSDALFNHLPRLQKLLTEATGIQHWCGTLATAICHDEQEYYDQPALSLLLCQFESQQCSLVHLDPEKNKLRSPARGFEPMLGVVHADPTNPEAPKLLQQCSEFGSNLKLFGGMTHSQTKQLQIIDNTPAKGLSGVLFNQHVSIISDYTQGCTPIGEVHDITHSENNVILELDGKPALEVLRAEVGEVLARDLTRLGGFVYAGIVRNNTDHQNYVIRDLLAIDENSHALVIRDTLQIGDQLVFCRRDGNTASDDLDDMLTRIQSKLGDRQARGALYYSCIERGRYLFGENSQELKRVQSALGDVPLAGFFASGEIYENQLYTHTGVLILFL